MSPLSLASPDALWLGMGAVALTTAGAATWVVFDQTASEGRTATLRFGSDLTPGQVRAMLDTVAGLRAGSVVQLRLMADQSGVSFEVTAAPGQLTTLTRTLAGIAPGVRVDEVSIAATADREPGPDARGAQLSWRGSYPLLRTDEPERQWWRHCWVRCHNCAAASAFGYKSPSCRLAECVSRRERRKTVRMICPGYSAGSRRCRPSSDTASSPSFICRSFAFGSGWQWRRPIRAALISSLPVSRPSCAVVPDRAADCRSGTCRHAARCGSGSERRAAAICCRASN